MIWLAISCLLCAAVPCLLFLRNLRAFQAPQFQDSGHALPAISVLIPARNEEANIAEALRSVLANGRADLEVIVLDDQSSDRTAEIVREFSLRDPRVRLEGAPPLPAGWCGKQHACATHAERARNPLLLFMDADVRLEPNGLDRMANFLADNDVSLASGVPRQATGTFWEKLLIPLIHFVLLGFLPLHRMRASTNPAYAAGCGQMFLARASAYRRCGGHAAIRTSLHDGIKLPRVFREHGFKTDLFDITEVARCRMYESGRAVFAGLAKNATEGLAAPSRILPITLLLGLGQVLPFVLLFVPGLSAAVWALVLAACACALVPRLAAIKRFRQSRLGALLHPVGVTALLAIQWFALARQLLGGRAQWRGRSYAREAMVGAWLIIAALPGAGAEDNQVRIRDFELNDQHDRSHRVEFPRTNCAVVLVADHKGSDQLEKWIRPVYERFGQSVAITGVANVSAVPPALRGMVQRAFLKELDYPVLLDWRGDVVRQFTPTRNQANVYLIQTNGTVLRRWSGKADASKLAELETELRMRQR